ncbi:substrate-binding domain-containing protein [Acidobacteria bacterium AB60]|nr:substrate-binding domain-containing protein [Acidobacteria bacterium AB60]
MTWGAGVCCTEGDFAIETLGERTLPKSKIKRLYLIPILSKGLDVLEFLGKVQGPISLEDVYKNTNISKTSVYRILKTLAHRGYVAQTQNGQYRLVARPRRLVFGFGVQSADLPFSQAIARSVTAAAAAAGVELSVLDNRFDSETAVKNAEEFVEKRVDLVLEFQAEESVAPRVANIFKKADIPVIAIDVPHPNATYFGVDNFECGIEAGTLLAQYAHRRWKDDADWILGVGFNEAGSFVQSRITGAFEAVRKRLPHLAPERFVQIDGRGSRNPSRLAVADFLKSNAGSKRILVAAATDSSALGVLDAARQFGREQHIAVVGQDCIPDALEEMQSGQSALIGSISHEAETYGPRLIQLGISMLRGHAVPPYNYVRHRVVTPESLAENAEKGETAAAEQLS